MKPMVHALRKNVILTEDFSVHDTTYARANWTQVSGGSGTGLFSVGGGLLNFGGQDTGNFFAANYLRMARPTSFRVALRESVDSVPGGQGHVYGGMCIYPASTRPATPATSPPCSILVSYRDAGVWFDVSGPSGRHVIGQFQGNGGLSSLRYYWVDIVWGKTSVFVTGYMDTSATKPASPTLSGTAPFSTTGVVAPGDCAMYFGSVENDYSYSAGAFIMEGEQVIGSGP